MKWLKLSMPHPKTACVSSLKFDTNFTMNAIILSRAEVISRNSKIFYQTTSIHANEQATSVNVGNPPTFGRNGKYSYVRIYLFHANSRLKALPFTMCELSSICNALAWLSTTASTLRQTSSVSLTTAPIGRKKMHETG